MERFKNILFASCGSKQDEAALDRANRLAAKNTASITLVRTVAATPPVAGYFISKDHLQEMEAAVRILAQEELKALAERVSPKIPVKTAVLTGKPFIELIRQVLSGAHDLLIKPGCSASEGETLDSTDLHLLRKCPCPVWIIHPTQRKPFGKVLVAVDPDPSDPERLALSADLLKLGTSLAQSEQGTVDVVHAWALEGEATLRGPRFKMDADEIETMAENVRDTRRKWVEELLAPYGASKIKLTLVKGEPGPSLVAHIQKRKPDIVVMGTVARTGLPGLLIGNTAEYVLGKIRCSVLAIKPRGFTSPVTP